MTLYSLVMLSCGAVMALSNAIFLVLFRPTRTRTRRDWIAVSLYLLTTAGFTVGLRLVIIYLGRLDVASQLSFWEKATGLGLTIYAAAAYLCFIVAYISNRSWGRVNNPE